MLENNLIGNILIVDDIPTNIQLVASILYPYNYELSFATSGQDAIKQVKSTPFDLILLDLMMPEMDGFELTQYFKTQTNSKDIPIIILTAKTDEESILNAFRVGASDFLSKPFNSAELLARVKTHLTLKFTQDQLRTRNQELATNIELKNKLLSVASHDLRSPLMTIRGFAHLLQKSKPLKEDVESQELLAYISKATEQMNLLITELLDTAAFEMGRFELDIRSCDLRAILLETHQRFKPIADKKNQTITLRLESITPIEADSQRLKQVFDNLLSNAIKYSQPGANIKISLADNQESISLRFQDQGPGFTAEDQTKLYGYFQRLSARPTQGEHSTGIGLAIIKQIMDLHHGTIELETTSDQGTTFLLTLSKLQPSKT